MCSENVRNEATSTPSLKKGFSVEPLLVGAPATLEVAIVRPFAVRRERNAELDDGPVNLVPGASWEPMIFRSKMPWIY